MTASAPITVPAPTSRPRGFRAACEVVRRLRRHGHAAHLVGGGVRDLVLGLAPKDFDVVTSATPREVQRLFRRSVPVGAHFGVITVFHRGRPHEVATYRAEGDYRDGRRPGWVEFADLRSDLERRDFTINGLVLDPDTDTILDWVGGLRDLADGLLRTIGAPEQRFREDALRMVRAVRFAARLGFRIEQGTHRAMLVEASRVRLVAAERIWQELDAMWSHPSRAAALRTLHEVGLLRLLVPEVHALTEATCADSPWERTLRRMGCLSAEAAPEVAWACVLADVVAPSPAAESDEDGPHDPTAARAAEPILRALRAPRALARSVVELLARRWVWPQADVLRYGSLARLLRRDTAGHLLAFWKADAHAAGRDDAAAPLARIARALTRHGRMIGGPAPPPFNGDDLLAIGLSPGPRFQGILADMERAWLEGAFDEAEGARRWLTTRGEHAGRERACRY